MIDAMRSFVELKYNESGKTKRITELMENFSFSDFASGSADSISLTLNDGKMEWMKAYYPKEDDWLKCWISTSGWPIPPAKGKLFCGKFQIDHMQFSGYGNRVIIEGTSVPQVVDFSVTQKDATWEETTVNTILKKLTGDAGIKLVWEAEDRKVKEISQSKTTDLEFAFSLCNEYGISLKVYNQSLIAYDQTKYEKKLPTFTITPKDISSYELSANINDRYDAVSYQYTDESSGETTTYNFKVPGTDGKRVLFVSEKAESVSDAEIKAKAKLRESLRQEKTISFSGLMGHKRYLSAKNFKLSGFGKMDGTYFIDSATHNVGGAYTCDLTAHKVVTAF